MENMFELMMQAKQKQELAVIVAINQKTEHFGVCLTEDEAKELVLCRDNSLKKYQRAEFGEGILEKLIFTFCDSDYIDQANYLATLKRLQDVFYAFKNESKDLLTDDELLTFMREQFDGVCYGDIEYLEGTCLEVFVTAIRAGYRGYQESGGHGEYEKFDEVPRWDRDVYMEVLSELFW